MKSFFGVCLIIGRCHGDDEAKGLASVMSPISWRCARSTDEDMEEKRSQQYSVFQQDEIIFAKRVRIINETSPDLSPMMPAPRFRVLSRRNGEEFGERAPVG